MSNTRPKFRSKRYALGVALALAVLGASSGSALASPPILPATVVVPATGSGSNYYTDSGISIPSGASVAVSSSGSWNVDPNFGPSGPDGFAIFFFNLAAPSVNYSSLIGSTDNAATWSFIGSGPSVVTGPGQLLLAANDCVTPAGCYSDNTGSVTAEIVGATPLASLVSADQCKNGGWNFFGVFKNQGDCVSYVATQGKNLPAS